MHAIFEGYNANQITVARMHCPALFKGIRHQIVDQTIQTVEWNTANVLGGCLQRISQWLYKRIRQLKK